MIVCFLLTNGDISTCVPWLQGGWCAVRIKYELCSSSLQVTDLLVPPGADGKPPSSEEATSNHLLKFVNVRCESFSTAVALLSTAMERSQNFCSGGRQSRPGASDTVL